MKFSYKPIFLKAFDKLSVSEQGLVKKTILLIKNYLQDPKASFGLRIKKLRNAVFEARVSDRLRIVWVHHSNEVTFTLLGNHEEVRRFIKNV